MPIWKNPIDLERINASAHNTLVGHLGMQILSVGDDYIVGTMPVDERTRELAVGLEINANHVRAVASGVVTGTARLLHRGRSTQLWEIRIEDAQQRLVCISRLTMAVVPRAAVPA